MCSARRAVSWMPVWFLTHIPRLVLHRRFIFYVPVYYIFPYVLCLQVVAVGLLYLASFIVVPFLEDSAASQPADSHLGAIHIDAGNVYQPGDVARPPPPVNQKDLDEIKQLRLENDALKAASMDTLRLENEALKTALRHQVMDAEAKRVVDPRAGRQADRTIDPARTVDRKQHKLKAQKKAELDSSARVKKASEPSVKWPPPPPPQFRNSQKWRTDGRCGPKYITEASPDFGECDPDADAGGLVGLVD